MGEKRERSAKKMYFNSCFSLEEKKKKINGKNINNKLG